MARTFRRTDAYGFQKSEKLFSKEDHVLVKKDKSWQYVENTPEIIQENVRKFHSDGHYSDGNASALKSWSNQIRRTNEREQLGKVYKCEDYEDAYYDFGPENHNLRLIIWIIY